MSRLCYKHKFKYDDNCGNLEEAIVYQEINNITDTETYYNDKGNIIEISGTSDYMMKLGAILCNIPSEDIKTTAISFIQFKSIFDSTN